MLTEQFVASIGAPDKAPKSNIAKDAAIFIQETQPIAAQRAVFKKSATPPNCLACSETHIFAAQVDKAVVNVYNRERGNQEAIVPFPERITCLALACDDSVLIMGTVEGRILLWETCTGRQITTAQSHLQAVTALAVDPTSNFLLSASADSTVHIWSIPALLSFLNAAAQALSPLQTFTSHRAEITALAMGHSSSNCNIAVTASKDRTCLIWDYHTNSVLRTYLLPSSPTCLTLDPADRAVYVGYEDGSVQQLDLYAPIGSQPAESLHNGTDTAAPVQPSTPRWQSPDASTGAALSISLSFDSCQLLSGHRSGAVLAWDVSSGRLQSNVVPNPFPGPVSNLAYLPVTGSSDHSTRRVKIVAITKPRFGAFDSAEGFIPGNYALHVELSSNLPMPDSVFQQALTAPSFSQSLLDEGLNELAAWGTAPATISNGHIPDETEDFMALDDEPMESRPPTLEEQNTALKAQLEALRRLQTASFDKIEKINAERLALLQREQKRFAKRGKVNGTQHGSEGTSSSSDEN